MDHGGRIVLCIDPLYGVFYDRLAQIALFIALAHAFVDGICNVSINEMNILSGFDEDNSHARILTDGNLLLLGHL